MLRAACWFVCLAGWLLTRARLCNRIRRLTLVLGSDVGQSLERLAVLGVSQLHNRSKQMV